MLSLEKNITVIDRSKLGFDVLSDESFFKRLIIFCYLMDSPLERNNFRTQLRKLEDYPYDDYGDPLFLFWPENVVTSLTHPTTGIWAEILNLVEY